MYISIKTRVPSSLPTDLLTLTLHGVQVSCCIIILILEYMPALGGTSPPWQWIYIGGFQTNVKSVWALLIDGWVKSPIICQNRCVSGEILAPSQCSPY